MRGKWVGFHSRIEKLINGSYYNEEKHLPSKREYEDNKEMISLAVPVVRSICVS